MNPLRLKISRQQLVVFIDIYVEAMNSVTLLSEVTSIEVRQRLESLNSDVVDSTQEGCPYGDFC